MMDIITVVFRDELAFLQTQALSFQLYLNPQEINKIVVVINDDADVANLIDLSWYGELKSLVNIVHYQSLGYITRVNGWENQQLCKLLTAATSSTEWSWVFDAKTWLVSPFTQDLIFENGRACVGLVPWQAAFGVAQNFLNNMYGLELDHVLGPGGVPFAFHTQTVRDLIGSIDNFIDFFQDHVLCSRFILVTEFHLYSAYVYKTHSEYFRVYSPNCKILPINVSGGQVGDLDRLFDCMQDSWVTTVSLHRDVYPALTESQKDRWRGILESKKLTYQF
jgi:hypothetical protein